MAESIHFPIFILVSLIAFIFILHFTLQDSPKEYSNFRISLVALVVVVGGMVFAKYGVLTGWPWWIYYGAPALLTWVLPPLVFNLNRKQIVRYLILAFLVAPIIHVLFSFFLGWKEYMPFIPVPAIWELFH